MVTTQAPAGAPTARQLGLEELGTPLIDTTFVVVDLETTGLSPVSDRITEIGAVKVRGGETLGELRTFVHPGRPVPPAVTAVTGITDAMLRDAPTIEAVLPTVLRFLGDGVVVGHNVGFDLAFLRAACETHGFDRPEPLVVDTARLARRVLHDEVRDHRLATLANHLRARTRPEHRALADARATVDVLHGLIERAGAYGATTLEDLRDLTRSTSDRAFRRIGLVRDAPRAPGVYRFVDERGEALYVGKATDLRQRLRTYFGQDRRRRIADLIRETHEVTWVTTSTVLEAEVRELRAIHALRPRYNRRSTRPESAVHVALTREPFPRLVITSRPSRNHLRTLGPLSSRRVAEQVVAAIQDVVPLRTCTQRLRRRQDHPACVLKELGRCGAPCDGTQSPDDYAEVVAAAHRALDDPDALLRPLRERMSRFARARRFERAQQVRERLHTTARALQGARDRAAIAAVDELVLARPDAGDTLVAVVRRGRLAGSARLEGRADDAAVLAAVATLPLESCTGPPTTRDAEELGLVLRWAHHHSTRLVRASDGWATVVAGGRALAETLTESRRLTRQLRDDRHLLSAAKVRRMEVRPDQATRADSGAPGTGGAAGRTDGAARDAIKPTRTSAPTHPRVAGATPAPARAT